MPKDHLPFASLDEAGALIRSGERSSVSLTELMLERIDRFNQKLNAFVTITRELALNQAEAADREIAHGHDRGPLHGIPIALKDNFATQGIRTTGGSKRFEDWVPEHDASVVRDLRLAGTVLLGKTGLHELAFGSTSVNPFFGAISNTWKTDHHPGGSSGGSAAAVAAGLAYAALGTDTGCSIRQPAHCCGIVGHKPTFGLVSKTGVIPLVWTMDHVGPLTRRARDAALVLRTIAGPDDADLYSAGVSAGDYLASIGDPVAGTRIGVPRGFFFEDGDPEVVDLVDGALETFRGLGAELVEVELPGVEAAYAAANDTFAEVVAAHQDDWENHREDYSPELQKGFEHEARVSAADYVAAQHLRRRFAVQVDDMMARCDVLVTPTSNVAAEPIERQPPEHARLRWRNTGIFDFTGQPSISVPCGFTAAGLPVGLMITGRKFEDDKVFRFAHAFEQATPWHERHPPSF